MPNIMLLYGHFTDNELVEKIRGGHTACFEILIRRYNPPLYRIGRMFGIEQGELVALICSVNRLALETLPGFDGSKTSYRVWLTGLMIQKCRVRVRTERQKHAEKIPSDPSGTALRTAVHFEPARSAVYQLPGKLEANLDKLPVSLRTIFVLHEIEGYSAEDTARLLHISEAHIKTYVSNAKNLLRKTVKNWYYHIDVYTCNSNDDEYIVNRSMSEAGIGHTAPITALPPR